jgi:hypothetical protein
MFKVSPQKRVSTDDQFDESPVHAKNLRDEPVSSRDLKLIENVQFYY